MRLLYTRLLWTCQAGGEEVFPGSRWVLTYCTCCEGSPKLESDMFGVGRGAGRSGGPPPLGPELSECFTAAVTSDKKSNLLSVTAKPVDLSQAALTGAGGQFALSGGSLGRLELWEQLGLSSD
ncbi:hypothetical protein EYF80_002412 [Liparis tanakae]|uniref:Uncharacterized protein n=1 Tax=Liparis tanakae TaxID=230148 RepID=A0A4Z2JAR8_9TELE|nr:hypothetical protein EYF80_002412 [Liparis tanakae]